MLTKVICYHLALETLHRNLPHYNRYEDQQFLLHVSFTMSASPPPPRSSSGIDRQATTPFLLNFCYRSSAFHNLTDFPVPTPSNPHPSLPAHLQIYTWMSCSLRELAHLLVGALPSIVPEPAIGTRLAFRLVYPDTSTYGAGRAASGRLDEGRGRYVSREMGSVVISAPSDGTEEKKLDMTGDDAEKTLEEVRFVIGDFIDCAVFPPLADGSVVARSSVSGRGGGGMRENGYGRVRGGGYGLSGRGGAHSRGDYGGGSGNIPSGEWRRGERLPESGGYRGGYSGRGGRGRPY